MCNECAAFLSGLRGPDPRFLCFLGTAHLSSRDLCLFCGVLAFLLCLFVCFFVGRVIVSPGK
jgi:hypothetical protein